jgi:protein TonB
VTAFALDPRELPHRNPAALRTGARERMAGSLGVGVALVLVAFAALIPVLSRIAPPEAVVIPSYGPLPPLADWAPPESPAPRTRTESKEGVIDPVEHEPPVSEERKDIVDPDGGTSGAPPEDRASERGIGDGIVIDAPRPEPGTWIDRDEEPVLVTAIKPEYPEFAKLAGVEGTVHVHAYVGRDGRVEDARIARSVMMLDEAALDAVRTFVFKPAYSAGHPVAVWVVVPIRFTLH